MDDRRRDLQRRFVSIVSHATFRQVFATFADFLRQKSTRREARRRFVRIVLYVIL
jgi:hypothetical protein